MDPEDLKLLFDLSCKIIIQPNDQNKALYNLVG